jgi:hypothetical protein
MKNFLRFFNLFNGLINAFESFFNGIDMDFILPNILWFLVIFEVIQIYMYNHFINLVHLEQATIFLNIILKLWSIEILVLHSDINKASYILKIKRSSVWSPKYWSLIQCYSLKVNLTRIWIPLCLYRGGTPLWLKCSKILCMVLQWM